MKAHKSVNLSQYGIVNNPIIAATCANEIYIIIGQFKLPSL
jgi:hypothetical protein